MALTFSQLFQLYAPLAGLLVLAFWVGGLSQRVKQLEKDSIGGEVRDRITRMEEQLKMTRESLEKVQREIQGIHRWLANSASKKSRTDIADIMSTE